jgi:hypothetical protein
MEQGGLAVVPSVGLSILGIRGLTAGSRGCALDRILPFGVRRIL